MAKKFTEKDLLMLLKGIKIPNNEDAVKFLGVDILEHDIYEKTGTRYLNNRFNPLKITTPYFDLSITISVNEVQADLIEKLVAEDYQQHKLNAAVAALIAANFTEEQAMEIIAQQTKAQQTKTKKKGK